MSHFNIYNIFGVHGKIWVLGRRRGFHKKNNLYGGLPKRNGGWLGHLADLGGIGKKEGSGAFEDGSDTPMHTMGYLALAGGENIK